MSLFPLALTPSRILHSRASLAGTEREEGRGGGGGGRRGERGEGVRCVYESISKHYTHSVTLPKGYPKNEDTSLKRKFFLTEQQFLHAINP